MSAPAVKSAAREAESSAVFTVFARAGYIANGVVHILLGVIVLVIAFGGDADGDQTGALKAVAGAPLGFVVLWLIAIALWSLALWRGAEGVLARDLSGDAKGAAKKWGRRSSEWGQAIVYVAVGGIAAAVALGARPDAEEATESASRGLLDVPGGSIVLAIAGVAIGAGGAAFVAMGILASFRKRMRMPSGKAARTLTAMGVVGFVAKGVALAIVGVLLLIAALSTDAETAGGIDGAVQAMLDVAPGPLLTGVVGIGFISYGAFTAARARFARM